MKYILSGEPAEVEKVIKENRIRVERGVITFTPSPESDSLADSKEVNDYDSKDVQANDDIKEPSVAKTSKRSKKTE